jgi:hypothetical protein
MLEPGEILLMYRLWVKVLEEIWVEPLCHIGDAQEVSSSKEYVFG